MLHPLVWLLISHRAVRAMQLVSERTSLNQTQPRPGAPAQSSTEPINSVASGPSSSDSGTPAPAAPSNAAILNALDILFTAVWLELMYTNNNARGQDTHTQTSVRILASEDPRNRVREREKGRPGDVPGG